MNSALPVMDASSVTQGKVGAKKKNKSGNDLFAALFHSHTHANPKKATQTPLSKNKSSGVPSNRHSLKDEVVLLSDEGGTAGKKIATPAHVLTKEGKKEQTPFSFAHKGQAASSHKTTPSKSPHAQTSFNLSEGTIEQNTKKVERTSHSERSGGLKTHAQPETKHLSKETVVQNKQPLQSGTVHKVDCQIRKSTVNEVALKQKRNIQSEGRSENASGTAMMPGTAYGDKAGSQEAKESLPKHIMPNQEVYNTDQREGGLSGAKKVPEQRTSHPSKPVASREQSGFTNVLTPSSDKKATMIGKESVATSAMESLKKSMAHVHEERVPSRGETAQVVSQKPDFSAAVKMSGREAGITSKEMLGKSDNVRVQSQPAKAKKITKPTDEAFAGQHVWAKKGTKKEKMCHDVSEDHFERSATATEMSGRAEKQEAKRGQVHSLGQKGAEVMVVKRGDESAPAPRNDATMGREGGMPSSMQESASDTAGTSADSGGQEFSKQQEHTPQETRQTFKMEIKLHDLVINARMRQETLQLMINMDGMHRMNGRSLGDEIQTILSESGFKSYKLTLRDKSRKMYEHTEEETAAPNRFGGQERINVRA